MLELQVILHDPCTVEEHTLSFLLFIVNLPDVEDSGVSELRGAEQVPGVRQKEACEFDYPACVNKAAEVPMSRTGWAWPCVAVGGAGL